MTDEELDVIRERCEKAKGRHRFEVATQVVVYDPEQEIARSLDDIPTLLAEIDRLRAALAGGRPTPEPVVQSRSELRRQAAMRGEPAPDFSPVSRGIEDHVGGGLNPSAKMGGGSPKAQDGESAQTIAADRQATSPSHATSPVSRGSSNLREAWELTHPMITSDEGEVYEGSRWDLVPKVGATVKGIVCHFPFDCEAEAIAVRDTLNRLAALTEAGPVTPETPE